MKITIEPTRELTRLDGVPVRVWKGVTDDGTPCTVFVHRVAVDEGFDQKVFERELSLLLPPREMDLPIPLRHVL